MKEFRIVEFVRERVLPRLKSLGRRQLIHIAAAAVAVILLLVTCSACISAGSANRRYEKARNVIGDELYSSMYLFCQTFDQVDVPGTNLSGFVLPAMEQYFTYARAQSELLGLAFGEDYAVLDEKLVGSVLSAFSEYETAIASSGSTDKAKSSMADCVSSLRALLEKRFRSGRLQPED